MSETLDVEVAGVAAGPGRQLAEAREAQGLAREHVAGQLRLSLHILEALENDDYAQLPPAAFVAGYLRSYARLLGLPEQDVVEGFAATEKTPAVGVVARSQRPQVRASDPQVRAVTYLVFGGLLLLSTLWWVAQSESPEQAAPAPEAAVTAPALVVETEPVVADPAVTAEAATTASEAATPVAPPTQAPTVPVADAPAASATAPAPEPVEAPAAAMSETPPPPPLTVDMPQSKLVLEFSADCWAEVTDVAGRTLAYDLFQAGRTLTLRGEAPFSVFFGYSPAAQVSLNGEVFDHSPYQRRNDTARFRVGSASDNTARTD